MQRLYLRALIYAIAVLIVFTYGISGTYFLGKAGGFNGFSKAQDTLLNATYFTVVTLGTIGYGDITPISPVAKVFVITLILAGVSIFLSAVAVIGGEFMNSRIETLYGRISAFDKRLFKNHVVLIGTNSTNVFLAEKLKDDGDRFILITSDKIKSEQLREKGFPTFIADATSDEDMKKFNLDKAKGIVIDVKDSSRAIYVLLVAKDLAKDASIVAIAPTEEAERHIRSLNVASSIVNPANIAAREIGRALFPDDKK